MTDAATAGTRKRGRPTEKERAERRDQILDAAVRLFVANGYRQTSFDDIAPAARVTKRTIYAYFGDKAEVFVASVARLRSRALAAAPEQTSLADLATRIVLTLHSDEAVGLHRLMIAESGQFPELAAQFYVDGPEGYIGALTARLDGSVPAGARPTRAEALFALLLGEPHRRRLLGLTAAPDLRQARRHAQHCLTLLSLTG